MTTIYLGLRQTDMSVVNRLARLGVAALTAAQQPLVSGRPRAVQARTRRSLHLPCGPERRCSQRLPLPLAEHGHATC